MPVPKDPAGYKAYIQKLSESHKNSLRNQEHIRRLASTPRSEKQLAQFRLIRHLGNDALLNVPKDGWQEITDDLAYIIGVLMGDGHLSKEHKIKLGVVDKEFADEFERACAKQFGLTGSRWMDRMSPPRNDVYNYQLGAKIICQVLHSIRNLDWVRQLGDSEKIAWLRGIWDSEGSISIKHRSRITKESISWTVGFGIFDADKARAYHRMLSEVLGIRAGIGLYGKGEWSVTFSRLEDVVTFYRAINPTIRRKRASFEMAAERLTVRGGM